MRCLVTHKWVLGKAFDFTSRNPDISFVIPHRTCERCGIMQRGSFDEHQKNITWETMREGVYTLSVHSRIVRGPSSWADRLAHTLGLRHSRRSDGMRSAGHSVQTGS